jgi:hypothetical protein
MRNLWLVWLTCLALIEGFCGCRSVNNLAQFSGIPETNDPLQEVTLRLEITRMQSGADPAGLASTIRRSYGPANNVYPTEAMDRDAEELAEKIIRGEKVVLRVRREDVNVFTQRYQAAGLTLRATE